MRNICLVALWLSACGTDAPPTQSDPPAPVPRPDAVTAAEADACTPQVQRACPYDVLSLGGSAWCAPLEIAPLQRTLRGAWVAQDGRTWEWVCADHEGVRSVFCSTTPTTWQTVSPSYPLRLSP